MSNEIKDAKLYVDGEELAVTNVSYEPAITSPMDDVRHAQDALKKVMGSTGSTGSFEAELKIESTNPGVRAIKEFLKERELMLELGHRAYGAQYRKYQQLGSFATSILVYASRNHLLDGPLADFEKACLRPRSYAGAMS